jgi:predicted lipoprotein with Yx(FWY)xxD motif
VLTADFAHPTGHPADAASRTSHDHRTMNRRSITFLASAAAIPLTTASVAACGGGGAKADTPAKTTTGPSATVGVAQTSLGKILVDSPGRTLYLFMADAGTKSACTGACAAAWPPLPAHGKPTAGGSADAGLLGTAARSDGARQVTYNGRLLYRFANDQKPGDVNGQGVTAFGAAWFVLSATGNEIATRSPSGGGNASSGGGGGY